MNSFKETILTCTVCHAHKRRMTQMPLDTVERPTFDCDNCGMNTAHRVESGTTPHLILVARADDFKSLSELLKQAATEVRSGSDESSESFCGGTYRYQIINPEAL